MSLAVDFDGVIHRYSRGWQDGSIYDQPMDGAIDGLRALMDVEAVFVFTSREPDQVARWLAGYGFQVVADTGPAPGRHFWNQRGVLLVTNRKLPARAYLDDRAVPFTSWGQALKDLTVEVGS
jgi:hypothetical protein